MERYRIFLILFLLFSINLLLPIFNFAEAQMGTITILANGLITPSDGRIVTMDNQTYLINTDLSVTVLIKRNDIIINGNGHLLHSPSVAGRAFELTGVHNVTIKNVRIDSYAQGIFLEASANNNTITGNTITLCGTGIWMFAGCSYNIVTGNNITNNGVGILVWESCDDNIIYGNKITSCGSFGIQVQGNKRNVITDNYVANSSDGIHVEMSNYNIIARNTVTLSRSSGIYMWKGATNNTVTNNVVTRNHDSGITSAYGGSGGNNITKNEVSSNGGAGIDIGYGSRYNNIVDNNVTFNGRGMHVSMGSNNNVIHSNNITSNGDYAIRLYFSSENIVTENIMAKSDTGLAIHASSNNNTVIGNHMVKNRVGVFVGGMYSGGYSCINTIYHNNFARNVKQAETDSSADNTWDNGYPSGGNYWSNYNGTDANHDGIGDTPYTIATNNNDRYPLMNPIGEIPFLDQTVPTILTVSPQNKTYAIKQVPLTFTVDVSTSWIGYSLDSQANVTVNENTTLTGLSDGTHSLKIYARNIDDLYQRNIGSSSLIHFTIDTIPPTIIIIAPTNKTYDTTDIQLTFTISENTSWIGYSLDGQANVTVTGNATLAKLSAGAHNIRVYAKDAVGNMGSSIPTNFSIAEPTSSLTSTPIPTSIDIKDIAIIALAFIVMILSTYLIWKLAKGSIKKRVTDQNH